MVGGATVYRGGIMARFRIFACFALGLGMAFPVSAQQVPNIAFEPDPAYAPQAVIIADGHTIKNGVGVSINLSDRWKLASYYPQSALFAQHDGKVHLTCDWNDQGAITTCLVKEETPAGQGFGDAAVALALAKATVGTYVFPFKVTSGGSGIDLVLNFHAAPSPCGMISPMVQDAPVKCVSYATLEELSDAYPARALDNDVEGSSVVECTVTSEEGLVTCTNAGETPTGYGFGNATVKTVSRFLRLKARQADTPITGVKVRITLNYGLD